MNRTEMAAVAAYPDLARLIHLRQSGGWVFQPAVIDGVLELICGYRVWLVGGWSDALAIHSQTSAKAFRCNADGGTVWNEEGTFLDVLAKLVELPKPDAPNAPRLVKATRKLWIPGMS